MAVVLYARAARLFLPRLCPLIKHDGVQVELVEDFFFHTTGQTGKADIHELSNWNRHHIKINYRR